MFDIDSDQFKPCMDTADGSRAGGGVLVLVHTRCQLISAMRATNVLLVAFVTLVACKLDDILTMVYI